MYQKLPSVFVVSIVFLISTCFDSVFGRETYDERLIVPFDGRHWIAAHAVANSGEILVEYVLEGEQVESWSELVTTVCIPVKPEAGILRASRDIQKASAIKKCDKANFIDLDSSDTYQLFTFDQELCFKPEKREYSIGCFFRGVDAVHLVIYAARNQNTYEKNFPLWSNLLKSATTFRPSPDTGGPGIPKLADPQKMIQVAYRLMTGDGRTESRKTPLRKLWRSGVGLARAEEEYDRSQNLQLTMITNEPDLWMINEATKQGQHIVDPGPTYLVHCPAFGEMKENGLKKLEFGGESDFFAYYGARKLDDESVKGTLCEVYELPRLYWILRLYLRKGTTVPVLLTRRGPDGIVESVCYDQYYDNVPFELSLFSRPKDIVIMEAQTK